MSDIDPTRSIREFYVFHLRRLREEAGLSQNALGDAIHVSGKLIGLVETLKRRPTMKLSKALDAHFGLDRFFEALVPRLAEEVGLPPGFWEYVEEEACASQIKMYYQYYLPGLLQTEAYAREILKVGKRADKVEELVGTRLGRQEILRKEVPPNLVVLIEESVIRKVVGSREIAKLQLEHLLALMVEPHITIQVVPDDAPVYPEGSFTVLGFDNNPHLGYEESVGGRGHLIESGPHVTELVVKFDLIRSLALNSVDSEAFIRDVWEKM
jgi:DNA-binding XRE family transcriptional regulator